MQQPRDNESSAKSITNFQKSRYLQAALAVLSRNGLAADIVFGRHYLSHDDTEVKSEAARIVQRFGNNDDVPALLKLARTSTDDGLKEIAVKACLSLSNNRREVVEELLTKGDEAAISVTVAELVEHADKQTIGLVLEPYLDSPKEEIRKRVMAFYALRYEGGELTELLRKYTEKPSYYYDVVCCFDRFSYAPPLLRPVYFKFLADDFNGLLKEPPNLANNIDVLTD